MATGPDSDTDAITCVDGTEFSVHSELIRGEGRWYWVARRLPEDRESVRGWIGAPEGTHDLRTARRRMVACARLRDKLITPDLATMPMPQPLVQTEDGGILSGPAAERPQEPELFTPGGEGWSAEEYAEAAEIPVAPYRDRIDQEIEAVRLSMWNATGRPPTMTEVARFRRRLAHYGFSVTPSPKAVVSTTGIS